MLRILVEPVLERRFQILESDGAAPGRSAGRKETRPGRRHRDREGLGNALGEFAGKIELPDRRLVAAFRTLEGRHRELVVDAGVVDREGGGKETVAGNFMRGSPGEGCQRKRQPRQGPAKKTSRHGFAPRERWT